MAALPKTSPRSKSSPLLPPSITFGFRLGFKGCNLQSALHSVTDHPTVVDDYLHNDFFYSAECLGHIYHQDVQVFTDIPSLLCCLIYITIDNAILSLGEIQCWEKSIPRMPFAYYLQTDTYYE